MEKDSENKEEVITEKDNNIIEETNKEENIETNNETKISFDEEKQINSKDNIKRKNNNVKIIFIIVLLIIFIIFISTIFAIMNINNNKIISGTYIENVDISNLSKEQAYKLLYEKISNIEEIELKNKEYSTLIKLEESGIQISVKDSLEKAINIGKSNNIIIDNYSILKTNIFKTRLKLDININEEKFKEMIKNVQAEMPYAIKEYSYEIKEDKLIIINGKSGESINEKIIKEEIIKNIINQFNGNIQIIDIPTNYIEPKKIDIEKIYNEVYKEPKDAYIVENEENEIVKLHKEEDGIDFKISVEEAKQILTEEKDSYSIPLKIIKPKIQVKDLGDKLFKQTLSKYTTIYDAGNYNRSHNIALAAKTINGTIILPGETFSYNGILGNTNKEKGYKVGTAYVGGKVVESYGGGICQVSSTLYNAVLYANLEIVQRYNHSYVVNYVPAGRDATVAYGGKDFKFKNTRTYPIKIEASARNGVVSITIKGIKEDIDKYEVVLTSSVLSTTQNEIIYENNSNLEEGKQKIIQKGYIGKKSIAYKIVRNPDGTIKSKTVLSKDTYKPMNKIVQVGTKKVISSSTQTSTTIQSNTEQETSMQDNTIIN